MDVIDILMAKMLSGGSGGGGSVTALKQTLNNLLIPILRQGLYGTDQEAAISALETALGGTPPVQTCVITNNLTNVTNSNGATAVNSGTAYTATLTPDSGMAMQTVTVTMGGVDVTSMVYSNGTISIASVTGNIVITAVAESLIETIIPQMTNGAYVQPNGTISESDTYGYTQKIPVSEGDKVYGDMTSTSGRVGALSTRFTCAYDSNESVVSSAGSGSSADYSVNSPLVVPAGVKSYVFSINTNRYSDIVVYVDKSERVGA